MNQGDKLGRISQLLTRFKEQVEILNSNGEFSINIHAENILIKVLNEIYDCNLENVNYVKAKNYPSIDLRDESKRIAVQVTSKGNLDKIKNTLSKFIENDLHLKFDKVFVFVITDKQNKYDLTKIDELLQGKIKFEKSDILDRKDLYLELNKQNNLEKINIVCKLLEEQFADNKELNKWDLYYKGLNEYDLYISNYYKFLDIKGFSPKINNTTVKLCLEDIYVPLKLKIEKENENKGESFNKDENDSLFTIEKAITNYSKLVILGDPGSGKSTLLKQLAYKICSSRPTEIEFGNFVPIIVKGSEFAKFVSTTSKNLTEYIIDQIDKKYELLFTQKLEENNLLVLVDGIDEINITNLRHTVVNKINAFTAQYPDCKIIVSSRIVGYKETKLNGYFTHFEVKKFNKKQIRSFVENWYKSIASNSDNDIEKAKESARILFRSIGQNSSVLNMASNPLLVTIIALIHYQGNTLPEKRAALYDVATATFLENWVHQRELHENSTFDKETLITILSPISYYIHQNFTTGLITETELKRKLHEEYRELYPYLKPKEEAEDVKNIINFLRKDAGFLFEKGTDENEEPVFGFVHQTFQEYFTAIEFKTLWKEGHFKENLEDYIFSPNWHEVIKLTASIFKFTEQSRLGIRYTTEFVKDILSVNDPIPEMHGPLSLVIQILLEDTQIDFTFLNEIVNDIFSKILINDRHGSPLTERETMMFIFHFEELLHTKTYQSFLLEKIIKEIYNPNTSEKIVENLIYILVEASGIKIVYDELLKILKSNNEKLKIFIFDHNAITYQSKIIHSKEFRNSIVKYVNSEKFISSYKEHIPIQYYFTFEHSNNIPLSIKSLENEAMRINYINFIVFSIGMSNIDSLKEFVEMLNQEYPGIKLPKIENHIKELEEFNSHNLNRYEIVEYKDVKLFKKEKTSEFALFKGNDKIKLINHPFRYEDFYPYFLDDTESYLKFLDLFIPLLLVEGSREPRPQIEINDLETFNTFIKYYDTIHWNVEIGFKYVLSFALKNIFSSNLIQQTIDWLKDQVRFQNIKFELGEDFDKNEFIKNTLASDIKDYQKLYLISLIGNKPDYESLLTSVIQNFKSTDSEQEKDNIKDVLYNIL
ncbi:SMEK domain-containing protein [Elizabethkingia anophelis]|uniref:SMEK domain-containing protein n=1 Tax=Elizabethkingia anophelis TaxID=1117645 RepID=UPI0021A3CEE1|nr:SMEK domain-containing protein [Elizabethkingia anophelis]MCT3977315.1 SMEK domain-containing protein [Elizabethkingia anophelis]MCT4040807.1 SMEK domain-containing protein [Elizabethkingia anophelis]